MVTNQSMRILVIEDDRDVQNSIGWNAKINGYEVEYAASPDEARERLQAAKARNQSFAVATVDMNYATGEKRTEMRQGKQIIQFIKSQFPETACIMISGSNVK
ncbi:MAG TPA: hypothetical protein VHL11_05200, partial [Phototrophicaceae bacterium]|nr:hypothetical protein [Phototrophicaceae bacterium]